MLSQCTAFQRNLETSTSTLSTRKESSAERETNHSKAYLSTQSILKLEVISIPKFLRFRLKLLTSENTYPLEYVKRVQSYQKLTEAMKMKSKTMDSTLLTGMAKHGQLISKKSQNPLRLK